MNFRISNKHVDEMLFSFLKENITWLERQNFMSLWFIWNLNSRWVTSDVATDFIIFVHFKGFITVKEWDYRLSV